MLEKKLQKQLFKERVMIFCSGGPDSLFLLNLFKLNNPLVLHVNYNKRDDSILDQKRVENFCKDYNLELLIFNLPRQSGIGNFQNWARQKRYQFALETARKYALKIVLVAHHKDDFLETQLIRQNRKNFLRGIPEENLWGGELLVKRPLLYLFWKEEIINYLNKEGIEYGNDITNLDIRYARARARLRIKGWSRLRKTIYFYWLRLLNIRSQKLLKRSCKIYSNWSGSFFKIDYFLSLKRSEQIRQMHLFVAKDLRNIVKFSSRKIESIIDFLKARNTAKAFKISKSALIKEEQGRLVVLKS